MAWGGAKKLYDLIDDVRLGNRPKISKTIPPYEASLVIFLLLFFLLLLIFVVVLINCEFIISCALYLSLIFPRDIQQLISACWMEEPSERPDFEQVITLLENHKVRKGLKDGQTSSNDLTFTSTTSGRNLDAI
jgi:hypothetical protein